jgi:hypothetical protein
MPPQVIFRARDTSGNVKFYLAYLWEDPFGRFYGSSMRMNKDTALSLRPGSIHRFS